MLEILSLFPLQQLHLLSLLLIEGNVDVLWELDRLSSRPREPVPTNKHIPPVTCSQRFHCRSAESPFIELLEILPHPSVKTFAMYWSFFETDVCPLSIFSIPVTAISRLKETHLLGCIWHRRKAELLTLERVCVCVCFCIYLCVWRGSISLLKLINGEWAAVAVMDAFLMMWAEVNMQSDSGVPILQWQLDYLIDFLSEVASSMNKYSRFSACGGAKGAASGGNLGYVRVHAVIRVFMNVFAYSLVVLNLEENIFSLSWTLWSHLLHFTGCRNFVIHILDALNVNSTWQKGKSFM